MAESLAVKYRPQEFNEVCSQRSVIQILEKQLVQKDVKNCYLFCGPSGTGKTTISRIYAHKLNEGIGQPIEIDAASNSGVENVRQIIKAAQERSLQGKYKAKRRKSMLEFQHCEKFLCVPAPLLSLPFVL